MTGMVRIGDVSSIRVTGFILFSIKSGFLPIGFGPSLPPQLEAQSSLAGARKPISTLQSTVPFILLESRL